MNIKIIKQKEEKMYYHELKKGDVFTFLSTNCLALKLEYGHVLFDFVSSRGKEFHWVNGQNVTKHEIICHGKLIELGLES